MENLKEELLKNKRLKLIERNIFEDGYGNVIDINISIEPYAIAEDIIYEKIELNCIYSYTGFGISSGYNNKTIINIERIDDLLIELQKIKNLNNEDFRIVTDSLVTKNSDKVNRLDLKHIVDRILSLQVTSDITLLEKSLRKDLGEIAKFRIDTNIYIWNKDKTITVFIFDHFDSLNPVPYVGVKVNSNDNIDCVCRYENNLFAISSDGMKLFHVNSNWLNFAETVYNRFNANPKFLTHSYQLQEDDNGEFIIIKNNEGFIDFQTMFNEEILNKK